MNTYSCFNFESNEPPFGDPEDGNVVGYLIRLSVQARKNIFDGSIGISSETVYNLSYLPIKNEHLGADDDSFQLTNFIPIENVAEPMTNFYTINGIHVPQEDEIPRTISFTEYVIQRVMDGSEPKKKEAITIPVVSIYEDTPLEFMPSPTGVDNTTICDFFYLGRLPYYFVTKGFNKLIISGACIQLGQVRNGGLETTNSGSGYFTLKFEGFNDMGMAKMMGSDLVYPSLVVATPCPPLWRPKPGDGIKDIFGVFNQLIQTHTDVTYKMEGRQT